MKEVNEIREKLKNHYMSADKNEMINDIQLLLLELDKKEKERKLAYSDGFAMAKFDCAMSLAHEGLTNEQFIDKWTKGVENIDNHIAKERQKISNN